MLYFELRKRTEKNQTLKKNTQGILILLQTHSGRRLLLFKGLQYVNAPQKNEVFNKY